MCQNNFLMGHSWPLFRLFSSFPHDTIQIYIEKRIGGVLGTRTRGGRMEGTQLVSNDCTEVELRSSASLLCEL